MLHDEFQKKINAHAHAILSINSLNVSKVFSTVTCPSISLLVWLIHYASSVCNCNKQGGHRGPQSLLPVMIMFIVSKRESFIQLFSHILICKMSWLEQLGSNLLKLYTFLKLYKTGGTETAPGPVIWSLFVLTVVVQSYICFLLQLLYLLTYFALILNQSKRELIFQEGAATEKSNS